jgi:hypothetical protein
MKRYIKNLMSFTVAAIDGEMVKVTAFYFDDLTLTIRYLDIETGY